MIQDPERDGNKDILFLIVELPTSVGFSQMMVWWNVQNRIASGSTSL